MTKAFLLSVAFALVFNVSFGQDALNNCFKKENSLSSLLRNQFKLS